MFMPNADIIVHILPSLYVGAGILMIMDASFNVAMEPFARWLPIYFLPINEPWVFRCRHLNWLGAVIGSWLPYIFAEFFNIAKTADPGEVPFNVTLIVLRWRLHFPGCDYCGLSLRQKNFLRRNIRKTSKTRKGLTQIFGDL